MALLERICTDFILIFLINCIHWNKQLQPTPTLEVQTKARFIRWSNEKDVYSCVITGPLNESPEHASLMQ